MFLVNKTEMTFHHKIVDLIYKMIFSALRNLDCSRISYFSIVFASQMVVLEYYNEYGMLEKMMNFLLYKYLGFYACRSLNLQFHELFAHKEIESQNEIQYYIQSSIDIDKLLSKINLKIIETINQIMFCRVKVTDELIKIKITDRFEKDNVVLAEELKRRFYKIEDIKGRKLVDLIMVLHQKNSQTETLQQSNDLKILSSYLIGNYF